MSPIGVVCLTVQSAHIIHWSRFLGGPPDPFVGISINGVEDVAKTTHQSHEFEPTWMETKYIVIHSLDDTLNLRLYDHHEHRRHALLGEARFNLSKLKEDAAQGGLHLPLIKDEKQRGELLADLSYYAVVESDSDGMTETSRGIVSLYIGEVQGLGSPCTVAQVSLGYDGTPIYTTHRTDHSATWEAKHDFYYPNKAACIISVKIIDDSDSVVGQLSLDLGDLVDGGVEWWPLSGSTRGRLRMNAVWRLLGGGSG